MLSAFHVIIVRCAVVKLISVIGIVDLLSVNGPTTTTSFSAVQLSIKTVFRVFVFLFILL
ncbi:hypothetical protein TYRP_005107 [Tyrophagus putrescentiae]|nr:hypothetical protein TYRP_005107 [Tyrophagus putrescentiae]